MTFPTALVAEAKQCLAKAAPIPGAPLWHMGRGNADDKATMQNAIDYLTCKAKAKLPFTEDEKHFLVELFEAFWWGGKALHWTPLMDGMPEAAELANHYVHGNGETLAINPEVYKSSVIVRETMAAMKAFIKESINKGTPVPVLKSSDSKFMRSPQVTEIHDINRNKGTQGRVLDGGVLIAEQMNKRLHYANNRFHLQAFTTTSHWPHRSKMEYTTRMLTRWRVDDVWDYAPFGSDKENAQHISAFPMGYKREQELKLPDGLSHYMTVLGIAKEFKYWAEWYEYWNL
jgi:hypothetical protein